MSELYEKNKITDVELESVVDVKVSESVEKNIIFNVELESVVDAKVSESVDKKKFYINDSGVSQNTGMEECAVEDSQNDLDKVSNEYVSNTAIENSVVEVEVSECTNVVYDDTVELERIVEMA